MKICKDWCWCDRTFTVFFVWPQTLRHPNKDTFFCQPVTIWSLAVFVALPTKHVHTHVYTVHTHQCIHTRAHAHTVLAPSLASLQTVVNKSQEEKTLSLQKGEKKEKCYMTAVPLGGGEGGRKRLDESRGRDTGEE